jgi:GNAT superfamily N-acetyltransferase
MRFVLSAPVINGVMYHMENRNGEFLFDTKNGAAVPRKNGMENGGPDGDDGNGEDVPGDGRRFIPLPPWSPADGYLLMETFADAALNGELRNGLRAALEQKKGVFRSFKAVLADYPEAARRWHDFKERALRRRVMEWYNELREGWGLARLDGEPEDYGELTRADFRFRPAREEDAEPARELHVLCREEKTFLSETGEIRALVAAETGAGEFAGYGGAAEDAGRLRVIVEVRKAFRGMGVGSTLLEQVLAALPPAPPLTLELPLEYEGFGQVLLRHGFSPATLIYARKPPQP